MSVTLTTQEREEALTLLTRLAVLLGKGEPPSAGPVLISPPSSEAAKINTPLGDQDFVDAAALLRCDVAAIRAVYQVESNGKAFGPDGRPIIRFEKHVFSRETGGKYDRTHGGVSGPMNNAEQNAKSQAERWDQLLYAARLDRTAAYRSASYGAPQIMGFNHQACAFPTVDAFVEAMGQSEGNQLQAFCQFIIFNKLDDELREHRWTDFARRYNGPKYAANAYDTKLAAAHRKWSQA